MRADWMQDPAGWSIHAEVAAMRTASSRLQPGGLATCVMYVFRVCGAQGLERTRLSRPCEHCESAIRSHGIRRVYYSCD